MKKKLLLTLVALSCFTLGSCGKKVGYDEAKEFATDTWSTSELSYTKCITKSVVEVKKSEGLYKALFSEGTKSNETETLVKANTFDALKVTFDDSYTFTISGKKLTVSKSVNAKDYLKEDDSLNVKLDGAEISGKGFKAVYNFNEEGLLTSSKVTLDMSFVVSSSIGASISGAINMVSTTTNTYTK